MAELKTDQPRRATDPVVKASRLAYIVFEREDLDRADKFLADFGLRSCERDDTTLYARGVGQGPYCYVARRSQRPAFAGFALEVPERSDLQRLARAEGAGVEALDGPCGGEVVRLKDPSGNSVDVVFGMKGYAAESVRPPLVANTPLNTVRVNVGQRAVAEAPEVCKLGHLVLEAADYQATAAWYTKTFGLIPSDVQVLADGSPLVAFLRLDLGDTPTDHHTLALGQGFAARFNHSAYEVVDLDAVGMGQRVLRERGYTHAWGIGRHLLGSQVFDYWQDPWGDKHEHYCDGDVFTADVPTGVSAASVSSLAQWGPPLPPSFVKPKLSLANLRDGVSSLLRSPDLSLAKLVAMAKLVP